MFRELTRYKQALSIEECEKILENELRGVLAIKGDDDYPYAFPMNHYYDKKNHCIFFILVKEVIKLTLSIVSIKHPSVFMIKDI